MHLQYFGVKNICILKSVHTENREFSPHITSFNFRVGAHPAINKLYNVLHTLNTALDR